MANIKLGGGVTDIRGSIGGTTFSRGPAGAYARQRVKPVNPATTLQNAVRSRLSALAPYWSATLTPTQREEWKAIATATNFVNKVGDTITITALALFVRLNALLLQMGEVIRAAAPLLPGKAGGCITEVSADVSETSIIIADPTSGFVKTDPLEYLAIFAGRPMLAGRTQSPTGFRFVDAIQGAATPPTFPMKLTWPYTAIAGQNYPVSITHVDKEGRVSAPVDYLPTVIA